MVASRGSPCPSRALAPQPSESPAPHMPQASAGTYLLTLDSVVEGKKVQERLVLAPQLPPGKSAGPPPITLSASGSAHVS